MNFNDDVLYKIFDHLDKKDIFKISNVSKQFYRISLSKTMMKNKYFKFNGTKQSIQTLVNRNYFIKNVLYSQINNKFFYIFPEELTKVKFINCQDIDLDRIPNKNLVVKICLIDSELNTSTINLENIFDYFPNLQYIFSSDKNEIIFKNEQISLNKKRRLIH